MKTIIAISCLLLSMCLPGIAKAAFTETKPEASQLFTTENVAQQIMQLHTLANLNRRQYEELTGHHLNLIEQIGFKVMQHRIKKELKQGKTTSMINQSVLNSYLNPQKGRGVRTALAIVLLLILVVIAVLLALLSKWK